MDHVRGLSCLQRAGGSHNITNDNYHLVKIYIKSLYIYLLMVTARFPYRSHRYPRATMYGSSITRGRGGNNEKDLRIGSCCDWRALVSRSTLVGKRRRELWQQSAASGHSVSRCSPESRREDCRGQSAEETPSEPFVHSRSFSSELVPRHSGDKGRCSTIERLWSGAIA
jgi:hypothetical protein